MQQYIDPFLFPDHPAFNAPNDQQCTTQEDIHNAIFGASERDSKEVSPQKIDNANQLSLEEFDFESRLPDITAAPSSPSTSLEAPPPDVVSESLFSQSTNDLPSGTIENEPLYDAINSSSSTLPEFMAASSSSSSTLVPSPDSTSASLFSELMSGLPSAAEDYEPLYDWSNSCFLSSEESSWHITTNGMTVEDWRTMQALLALQQPVLPSPSPLESHQPEVVSPLYPSFEDGAFQYHQAGESRVDEWPDFVQQPPVPQAMISNNQFQSFDSPGIPWNLLTEDPTQWDEEQDEPILPDVIRELLVEQSRQQIQEPNLAKVPPLFPPPHNIYGISINRYRQLFPLIGRMAEKPDVVETSVENGTYEDGKRVLINIGREIVLRKIGGPTRRLTGREFESLVNVACENSAQRSEQRSGSMSRIGVQRTTTDRSLNRHQEYPRAKPMGRRLSDESNLGDRRGGR